MAPKKTDPKTLTVPKGRIVKPKLIKEKPKLKTPTIVKVKIPKKNLCKAAAPSVTNGISQNPAILNKKPKDLTSDDKLKLANTIAKAQLDKSEPVIFPPDEEPPKAVRIVKKRGPRKKQVEEKDVGSTTAVSIGSELEEVSAQPTTTAPIPNSAQPTTAPIPNSAQPTTAPIPNSEQPTTTAPIPNSAQPTTAPIPKPKRKYVRKIPVNAMKAAPGNQVKKTQPVKRKLVTPSNENTLEAKKLKRRWTQSRITDMKIVVRRDSIQSTDATSPKSDKTRTVTIAKPIAVKKRGPRGKKKDSTEDSLLGSPSILRQPISVPQPLPAIKQETHETAKTASQIESRKTSFNSELSWTKDISDSSNTTSLTAVTSSDVVLIDNKLPVLSLCKVDPVKNQSRPPSIEKEFLPRTPSDSDTSSSDSDSDSDSTTRCNSFKESEIVDVNSPNLSTSSESHRSPIITQKNIRINTMNSSVNKIDRALDKLAMSLKKIDMEIINWVGYQNEDININNKKIKDKIFQNLQEESNIILQCQHVNKLLTENEEITSKETCVTANTEDETNDANFIKPSDVTLSKTINKTSDTNLEKASHSADHIENKYDVNENFALDNIPYVPFDQSLDDEDALSLYAESIGFESHRNSISSPPHNPTEFEEYIPQPITNPLPNNTIVYNPTKINSNTHISQHHKTVAMICEKQNADSTSVFKEANQEMNLMEGIETLPVPTNIPVSVQMKNGPCLLSYMFRPVPGAKSTLFKGMCFFNLIDSCKNNLRCRFPHVQPAPIEVSARLARLSEELFIQEYMLMKSWPGLRRKFGLCFFNECKRRDLTRFLIEMSMDFVMKANRHSKEDALLKTHILEEALLVLNNADLQTYGDLLKYVVMNQQFCNIFMEAIADTQNFSRFKPVFIKLTEFIIGNNEMFSINVAKHILERVVILPFEEPLARALISIIEHTDPVIYENPMMDQFEKQLASNQNLLEMFLEVKEKAGMNRMVVSPEFNPAVPPPVIRQEVEMMTSPLYPDRMQRYTSPDTTHLDPMNKPPDEPTITRTIHLNHSFPTTSYNSSSSSESTEDYPRTPKPNSLFKSWRDRSIFYKNTPRQQRFANSRWMEFGGRQVSCTRSPAKFSRHPRPY